MSWTPSGSGRKPHLGIRGGPGWTRPGRVGHSVPRILQLSSEVAFSEHRRWCCTVLCLIRKALPDVQLKSHNIFIFKHFPVSELVSTGALISQHLLPGMPATRTKQLQAPSPLERTWVRMTIQHHFRCYQKTEKAGLRQFLCLSRVSSTAPQKQGVDI